VDTQMLGIVTVEIELAPASILMLGAAQTAAAVTVGNNTHLQKQKLEEVFMVVILYNVEPFLQLKRLIIH
jgi:hypothetical protein